jgi:hypothetical protein
MAAKKSKPLLRYKEIIPQSRRSWGKGPFDVIFGSRLLRQTFKKWSAHGLVPVALGALVVIDGSSAIEIRSIAVVACALWLVIDIGAEISDRNVNQQAKLAFFSAVWAVCFSGAMGCMYYFLKSDLDARSAEAYSKLSINMYMPPDGNAFYSEVSIANGGLTLITKKATECRIVQLVGLTQQGGDLVIRNIGQVIRPDGHGYIVPDGGSPPINDAQLKLFMDSVPLASGGDAQTDFCIPLLNAPPNLVTCADVEVTFYYQLETEPGINEHKTLRFVARKEEPNSSLRWRQEPVEHPAPYCPARQGSG